MENVKPVRRSLKDEAGWKSSIYPGENIKMEEKS